MMIRDCDDKFADIKDVDKWIILVQSDTDTCPHLLLMIDATYTQTDITDPG